MKTVTEATILSGTRVFVRADLNVNIRNGKILDTYRLESNLPTLNYIIKKGGLPIIAGHIGQPKGRFDSNLSTQILLPYFERKLGKNKFKLLENLRFDLREEKNNLKYAQELAQMADVYVNESFDSSHREHASIVGVSVFLPSYAGIRFAKEVEVLEKVLNNPSRPLVTIIGGAKLESKMPAVDNFLKIADKILLGGKISQEWNKKVPEKLVLPIDYIATKDIGIKTRELFAKHIKSAKTILWAGPMGLYQDKRYIKGTKFVAQEIISSGAYSIVGGGDTITCLRHLKLFDKMSFVSTGGGSMLEFLANGTLVGIEALK